MNLQSKLVPVWLLALGCLTLCREALRAYDWQPPPNKIAVLAVCAHPDDEGIFFGGSLPYYSTVLNLPTMLVCMADSQDSVREDELRCAAWTYGLRYEPIFGHFDNRDTMLITNSIYYTNTLDLNWDVWMDGRYHGTPSAVAAGKARAINFVAEQIRRYRPDVIITHDLNGETGHDNHKATAYAVTQAFLVAADPSATATNLVGLPPWQAQKLYVHFYPTNRFFHTQWETPFPALSNQTPHQAVNIGLACHVSQGPGRSNCASVYPPAGWYVSWPSEWWGLYASTVGPDTVLSSNLVVKGYTVPGGVAAGDFLEHLSGQFYQSPVFTTNPLILPPAAIYDSYTGQTLANYAIVGGAPISTVTFSKISGPDWLGVAADGTLSGLPSRTDAGTNSWIVGATSQIGLMTQATLTIPLLTRPIGMEDLMGWWKLSETNPASPLAVNSAPLSPDGVSYGGTIFGQAGARSWSRYSVQFSGTAPGGKIDVPYLAALNPPKFTVALWANVTGGSGTYRSPLTSRKITPRGGYMFYAGPNDRWQFWTGNGSAWNTLTAGPVVTNTWIHLAATYDGSTACFYTNGTLAAGANVAIQLNDTFPLRIGAGATEGAGNYWFPGLVDDVRIYRVALDSARVSGLFTGAPTISYIQKQLDGTLRLGGVALSGQTYILMTSPSRGPGAGWVPVATNMADASGNFQFIDADVSNDLQRFYRLIMP